MNNSPNTPKPLLSSEETVEDRYTRIVGSDSPIIQQARTSAAQTANSRGLLNSSIAAGAGEDAAARAALPIAQQDAGNAFQRGQGREVFGQNRELQTQSENFQQGQQGRAISAQSNLSRQEAGQQLTAQTQSERSERERQIADIQARFGLSRQEAEQQLRSQSQAETSRGLLSSQEAGQQLTAQTQAERSERERQLTAIQAQQNISRQEAEQQLRAQTQGEGATLTRQTQAETAALRQQTQQENFQRELAAFNQDSAVELQTLQNRNLALIDGSEDARNYSAALNQQISQILTDDSLDAPTKQNMINALIDQAQPYFDMQSALLEAAGIENVGIELGNWNQGGANDTVTNADGTTTTTGPDGNVVTRDAQGNVVNPQPAQTGPVSGSYLPAGQNPPGVRTPPPAGPNAGSNSVHRGSDGLQYMWIANAQRWQVIG